MAGILSVILLAAPPVPGQPASSGVGQEGAPARAGEEPAGGPPKAPRTLTLAEAFDLAAKQNLDLAAARLQSAVARAGLRIAREIPNPSATVEVLRDTPHESLLFDQPLEVGGKRARRTEVARQESGLAELDVAALERQIRRQVREAFYGVMAARGATSQRADSLALAERLREIAQARFDAGDVPQLEVFQADLEVSRAQADLAVAREAEKTSSSRLSALFGESAETAWETVGSLEDLPEPGSQAEMRVRAARSNPELARLAQERKLEESRRSLLRAERVPDLHVEFGSDFNAPGEFRAGPRGGISMELPIFRRNQGELARSDATLRALEGQSAAAGRAVVERVDAAYYEWSTRKTQAELYRGSLVPAARRLGDLAEESYRAGKSGFMTVLDSQRNVQQIAREYLDSLLAVQAAFARLEEAVGEPLDASVSP